MVIKKLDIRIQAERTDKDAIIVRSGERVVGMIAYYAREEKYKNVHYNWYLQQNARRVALYITDDLDMVSGSDYFQIRDTIESMLDTLHRYSVVKTCYVGVSVLCWCKRSEDDNEEHD